jgi:hypothetical protein
MPPPRASDCRGRTTSRALRKRPSARAPMREEGTARKGGAFAAQTAARERTCACGGGRAAHGPQHVRNREAEVVYSRVSRESCRDAWDHGHMRRPHCGYRHPDNVVANNINKSKSILRLYFAMHMASLLHSAQCSCLSQCTTHRHAHTPTPHCVWRVYDPAALDQPRVPARARRASCARIGGWAGRRRGLTRTATHTHTPAALNAPPPPPPPPPPRPNR